MRCRVWSVAAQAPCMQSACRQTVPSRTCRPRSRSRSRCRRPTAGRQRVSLCGPVGAHTGRAGRAVLPAGHVVTSHSAQAISTVNIGTGPTSPPLSLPALVPGSLSSVPPPPPSPLPFPHLPLPSPTPNTLLPLPPPPPLNH